MSNIIWHNGNWLEDNQAIYGVHDRVRLGECVFATILADQGRLVRWGMHIEKLLHNLGVMKLSLPYAPEELLAAGQDLLEKNGLSEGRAAFNIFVSGGPGGNGIRPPETRAEQICMRALPCPSAFPPVKAIIAQSVRRNEGSPLSQIKCGHYGENILAVHEAQDRGAHEAILLNNHGCVACASVASVFAVLDGALYTPPLSDGAQGGVTRRTLIERHGAVEKRLSPEDLFQSEGIYLANSLRGVVPVVSLDGRACPAPSVSIPADFHLYE